MVKPITENTLFYGDNLPILREYIPDESIDLIYLDPPFNSNRTYNVLFKQESGQDSEAQIAAALEPSGRGNLSRAGHGRAASCRPDDRRVTWLHRPESNDGLPGHDGRPAGGVASGVEADRQPLPSL